MRYSWSKTAEIRKFWLNLIELLRHCPQPYAGIYLTDIRRFLEGYRQDCLGTADDEISEDTLDYEVVPFFWTGR